MIRITKSKSTITTIILLTTALITLGQAPAETLELSPGQTIERETTGAETHRYKITLEQNEFFQVRVEQKGVDIVINLLNNDRKLPARMDSPNEESGLEILSRVATEEGIYQVMPIDPLIRHSQGQIDSGGGEKQIAESSKNRDYSRRYEPG